MSMSRENILVVDDEVHINAFIRELVTNAGYHAEPALSGEEALSILSGRVPQSEQVFDLILLDIMLPGMDGYQVCRAIKSDPAIQDVSVIMLTAMGKVADRAHGLEIGADDYIPKPFDNRELLARIEATLRVRRAEQETRRRNRELAALNAVAETVGRAIELPDVLNTALDQVLRALEMEAGTITLTNLSGAQAFAARRWERLDLSVGLDAAEQAVRSGQPMLCSVPVGAGSRPAACVPLRSHDRIIGALLVAGGRGASADADTLDLLTAIGHQVGAAVERARLYEAAQARSEDLAILNDITRAITSTLDLNDVLSVSMRGIREFMHVEAGSLVLVAQDSGQLVFRKMLNRDQEWDADYVLKPGEGLVGRVVEAKEPVLVNDAQAQPLAAILANHIAGLVTHSVLCVPIVVKGKAIGAIEALNKINGPFTNDDLETLSFIAASVGVAVENARLYGELAHSKIELERSQAQLIQAEKLAATGRLAASMAHEINNPLQAIHNCLHLVIHRPLTDEKKARYLQMAQEEVERLTGIVTRTLDFYRPSKGKISPTQVNDVIESVLALAGKKLQHSRVRIVRQLAPDLPPIQAVTDQLTQVFLNLVLNSAEAMAANGGELTITTAHDGDWIRASVSDDGPGISAEDADKIFEPFYTTKAAGTGLGLAISYGIIQRHGGRLMLNSESGHGATFTVELPIQAEATL